MALPGGGLAQRDTGTGGEAHASGGTAVLLAGFSCHIKVFLPLSPHPLPRRGRGWPRLFHARGFAPCIPGLKPGRRGLNLRWRCPAGGLPSGTPKQGANPAPSGSTAVLLAGFSCRIKVFLPLSPRPPSPFGEGGDFLFSYVRGFAPCIPGAEPGRHGLNLRWRCPAGGLPSLSPADLAFSFFSCPYPPDPLPRRGRGRF